MKSRDQAFDKKYDTYVEHPRFGRSPRYTGLNPDPYSVAVQLHWNATNVHESQRKLVRLTGKRLGYLKDVEAITPTELPRIAGTAIVADPSKQNSPTVPVTCYYDLERVCRSCTRPFIFFAEEQKHWYEVLRFRLDVDCVLCPPCRKREQFLAKNRAEYERLVKAKDRDWKGNMQLAKCALALIESGIFNRRVIQRVRASLKTVPVEERDRPSYQSLVVRAKAISDQSKK